MLYNVIAWISAILCELMHTLQGHAMPHCKLSEQMLKDQIPHMIFVCAGREKEEKTDLISEGLSIK